MTTLLIILLLLVAAVICAALNNASAENEARTTSHDRSFASPCDERSLGGTWAITATRASVARAELHSDGFSVAKAMRSWK